MTAPSLVRSHVRQQNTRLGMNCVPRPVHRFKPLLSITRSNCHYFSAVCLQRRPKVVRSMNVVEKTMSDLLFKREIAVSLYSDHEVRHFEDL